MMMMDKENRETLNVEIEREGGKTKSSRSSSRELYVQVKRRRVKRQYRRNQDAINFLRRFTLAVVVIDLILSVSESSLISTFFLFLTLSTTFDVKPENVIDTYCYNNQGVGNTMCEQYMERVTGYPTPSSTMKYHHHSSTSSSPENHFPTVPSRPPLTPSESRKLFLAYNQSLFDSPVRFNLAQKIEKDSKLSKLYSRLVYLIFENDQGILNANRTLSEFLKYEISSESNTKSQKILLQSLISDQMKESIEIISPHAPSLAIPWKKDYYMLLRLCSKTLDKFKSAQRVKQKRMKEESNHPSTGEPSWVTPLRKNLIQATEFIRHRWKRNAHNPIAPSGPSGETSSTSSSRKYENDHDPTGENVGTEIPTATGSSILAVEQERKAAAHDGYSVQQRAKKRGESGLATSLTSPKLGFGNGYRQLKGHNNTNKTDFDKQVEFGKKETIYETKNAAANATTRNRDDSFGHPENLSTMNRSREYYKRDVQMIYTMAEGNLNDLMMNHSHLKRNKTYSARNEQQSRKNKKDEQKVLEELSLGLNKSPRQILSLMEVALFNNWQRFTEISKRLSVYYRIDDNDTPKGEKEEAVIWLSARQKIIESLMLNMETNVFSPEILKKAEWRKRAVEQIYHDYSSSILTELKNAKEMPVSRTFQGIYSVIKIYVIVWQMTICLVLFFGSVFEDKTALNIWGIFNILTSLLHFMVDDWINTSFHPEKTSSSIWFGVIYGVYKPITILLVATLSSEIVKKDSGKKKGVIGRVCEIIRGRKRPPQVADKCFEKLKGLFISSGPAAEMEGGDTSKTSVISAANSGENNDGNMVYKGIKAVKIRATIKRMEMNNGNLTVITQTASPSGVKNEHACVICGVPSRKMKCNEDGNCNDNEEKTNEGNLFYPSAPVDNEAGVTEDLYPEETDDEEEDEDELEEVVDEDESDEEDDDGDNEECSYPDQDRSLGEGGGLCGCTSASNDKDAAAVMTREKMVMLSEGRKSAGGSKSAQNGISIIANTGNCIQGNLLFDSKIRSPCHDDLLRGPVVDGGNLHI